MWSPQAESSRIGMAHTMGLHIDLACTKRRRLGILLREEGAFGAHTLKLPSLWQGRAGGQPGHIGHGTTSFFVAVVENKGRAGGGGRTTPVQVVQACCPSSTRVLLYRVPL
jgi:hypothetical protein